MEETDWYTVTDMLINIQLNPDSEFRIVRKQDMEMASTFCGEMVCLHFINQVRIVYTLYFVLVVDKSQ